MKKTIKIVVDISEEYYNLLKGFDDEKCSLDMLLLKNGIPATDRYLQILNSENRSICEYSNFDSEGCWCSLLKRFVDCIGSKNSGCKHYKEK